MCSFEMFGELTSSHSERILRYLTQRFIFAEPSPLCYVQNLMSKALAEPITEAWIDLMLVFALNSLLSPLVVVFGDGLQFFFGFDDALLLRLS